MTKSLQTAFLVATLVVLSLSAAVGLREWLYPPIDLKAAVLLPEPNANLQGYKLTIAKDTPIYFDVVKGKWLLIYFGYSSCPEDCQHTLSELNTLVKKIDGVDQQYSPLAIFISLKPAEDTPETFPAFMQHYPNLHGASGHNDELDALKHIFGLSSSPSRIYIIDPQLRYIGSFAPSTSTEVLYADLQLLIHQLWRYHNNR